MKPMKMTAMLSSFFLLDSLTVSEGGGPGGNVAAVTRGDAGETVATSGACESASLNVCISNSFPLFLASTTLAFSPLICNRTLDDDTTPAGIFFLSFVTTFLCMSAAAALLAVKWRFLRA